MLAVLSRWNWGFRWCDWVLPYPTWLWSDPQSCQNGWLKGLILPSASIENARKAVLVAGSLLSTPSYYYHQPSHKFPGKVSESLMEKVYVSISPPLLAADAEMSYCVGRLLRKLTSERHPELFLILFEDAGLFAWHAATQKTVQSFLPLLSSESLWSTERSLKVADCAACTLWHIYA